MSCLQPEIMIVNGFYQNGSYTRSIGTKRIRINLVTHQRRIGSRDSESV